MKQIIILAGFVLFASCVFGQQSLCSYYELPFEPTLLWENCSSQLVIDTVSDSNNVWQIGVPGKTEFDSSYSPTRAILTDTLNTYPPNDTSSFIVLSGVTGNGFQQIHTFSLAAFYKVNTDSLNDYGTIEFSPDNGISWIDLLNDTIYDSYYSWYDNKPALTGNSNGWKWLHCDLAGLGQVFEFQEMDTVLYRFTFISDSIDDGLDGIMFDDFDFQDYVEGINEYEPIKSTAYPNPTNGSIIIEFDNNDFSIFHLTVTDVLGKLIYKENLSRLSIQLATNKFPDGIYYYNLINSERTERAWGKFIVRK